jgi:DnaJ-class molecular chaperone
MELPVSLPEAVLGGKVQVPTIDGPVSMTIPKGASSGRTLRLKGRGIAQGKNGSRGDQYVRLKIVLPEEPDPELEKLIEKWAKGHAYDPRDKLD